jgi:hypothetical protein
MKYEYMKLFQNIDRNTVIWFSINQHAELTETLIDLRESGVVKINTDMNSSKLYRKYLGSEHDLQKIPRIEEQTFGTNLGGRTSFFDSISIGFSSFMTYITFMRKKNMRLKLYYWNKKETIVREKNHQRKSITVISNLT